MASSFPDHSPDERVTLYAGDCLEVLRTIPDASVDAVITDPPYELTSKTGAGGFMGQKWDSTGIAFNVNLWRECLRVLKPGGHLLAFGGTRTVHRMTCAIEDAGFEIRDSIAWLAGQGFPKSLDVSKAIDKAAGMDRTDRRVSSPQSNRVFQPTQTVANPGTPVTYDVKRWSGWGTGLKPAWECITLARKPFKGTVAANVMEHGTGALNIDGCRIEAIDGPRTQGSQTALGATSFAAYATGARCTSKGVGPPMSS